MTNEELGNIVKYINDSTYETETSEVVIKEAHIDELTSDEPTSCR